MSINRVPILIWGTLTASVANLLAVPAVSLAFFLLWMDRQFGTHFFDGRRGPAAAVAAPVLDVRPPVGLRDRAAGDGHGVGRACRPSAGGRWSATRRWRSRRWRPWCSGFGVWVHHMFATGLPNLALSFFSGASLIITVPSAVAVFAWMATIWIGRPVITTAFLFFASMIVLFVIGGVSGLHDRARCRSTGS